MPELLAFSMEFCQKTIPMINCTVHANIFIPFPAKTGCECFTKEWMTKDGQFHPDHQPNTIEGNYKYVDSEVEYT